MTKKIYRSIIINMFKFKFRTDLKPLNEIKCFKKKSLGLGTSKINIRISFAIYDN